MGIVMQSMWARRVSGGLNGREVTILNPWLGWRIRIQNNGEGENPKLSPTVKISGDIRADVSGGESIASRTNSEHHGDVRGVRQHDHFG